MIFLDCLCGDPYDLGRKCVNRSKGILQYLSEDELKANPSANDSYVCSVVKTFQIYDQPFQILTKSGRPGKRQKTSICTALMTNSA